MVTGLKVTTGLRVSTTMKKGVLFVGKIGLWKSITLTETTKTTTQKT